MTTTASTGGMTPDKAAATEHLVEIDSVRRRERNASRSRDVFLRRRRRIHAHHPFRSATSWYWVREAVFSEHNRSL